MQRGALSTDLIGHFFGAFIIEVYEYPEIRSYIERTRKNFHQPEAFAGFESVAKAIEEDPRFASLVIFAKTMCPAKPRGIHRHEGMCRNRPLRAFAMTGSSLSRLSLKQKRLLQQTARMDPQARPRRSRSIRRTLRPLPASLPARTLRLPGNIGIGPALVRKGRLARTIEATFSPGVDDNHS
jgi:hypothetical protein